MPILEYGMPESYTDGTYLPPSACGVGNYVPITYLRNMQF
jgi:hypothetical protein